jgi:hypothetical protein
MAQVWELKRKVLDLFANFTIEKKGLCCFGRH